MRCPNCFSEIGNSSGSCPCCGYDLGAFNRRTTYVDNSADTSGWNKNYYDSQYVVNRKQQFTYQGINGYLPAQGYYYPDQRQTYYYEKQSYGFTIGIGVLSGVLAFNVLLIISLLIVGLQG